MAHRPPRPCPVPMCRELVKRGYCAKHTRDRPMERAPDTRPAAHLRGYDGAWKQLRKQHLLDEPFCRRCLRDGRGPRFGTLVDHIVPLEAGGARLDPAQIQTLCRPCHKAKTDEDVARYPEVYAGGVGKRRASREG